VAGRNGDNLITAFQCETCHFTNIMKREPIAELAPDIRIIKCIRRASLDAFWCSESRTVASTLNGGRMGADIARSLGFVDKLYKPMGPFPLDDTLGMAAAI